MENVLSSIGRTQSLVPNTINHIHHENLVFEISNKTDWNHAQDKINLPNGGQLCVGSPLIRRELTKSFLQFHFAVVFNFVFVGALCIFSHDFFSLLATFHLLEITTHRYIISSALNDHLKVPHCNANIVSHFSVIKADEKGCWHWALTCCFICLLPHSYSIILETTICLLKQILKEYAASEKQANPCWKTVSE